MYRNGGATTTSTLSATSPALRPSTSASIDAFVPLHFQFPPTMNLPSPCATTRREVRAEGAAAREATRERSAETRPRAKADPLEVMEACAIVGRESPALSDLMR